MRSPARTATASLLYWLLVVCGLAGVTVLRIGTPGGLAPLWVGSVVGVALGQLAAWLRVRPWLLGVLAFGSLWSSPLILAVLYQMFGSLGGGVETCLLAFLPAAICGYLSLSERGGLVAFWYPAVLWMLVVLDRPGSGARAFDVRTALPLVIGLAALFVAFLRARETRRAAIWHAHAHARLATPLPRKVLRTSPLRSASQLAWTGFAGAAALVLTTWIAPHLWQKDAGKHAGTTAAQTAQQTPVAGSAAVACCPAVAEEETRERVREYFPLMHGREVDTAPPVQVTCTPCSNGTADADNGGYTYEYAGAYGGHLGVDRTPTPPSIPVAYGGTGTGYGAMPAPYEGLLPTTALPTPTPTPTPPAPPAPRVVPSAQPEPPLPAPAVAAAAPPVVAAKPTPPVASSTPTPAVIVLAPEPAASSNGGAPWRSALMLCAVGLALHVCLRAARRQLTLRHLARPFWPETLDQRISNHWQRMLIGLRDAGIHPADDEQPEALARRVGIDGMSTCAMILERVRHGVRVDAADLDAMDAAAAAVYRAARTKAGLTGRAVGLVRSPL